MKTSPQQKGSCFVIRETQVSMGFGSRCPAILGGTLCLLANRCNRCHKSKRRKRFDARLSRSFWMSSTAATSTGHSRKLVSLWCCGLWWLWWNVGYFQDLNYLVFSRVFADVESARAVGSFFVETCSWILIAWGCFTFCGTYILVMVGRSFCLCLPLCLGFGSQPGNTLSFLLISKDWSDFIGGACSSVKRSFSSSTS